jgi:magnesium-protoporphyrin O-methyltransferase
MSCCRPDCRVTARHFGADVAAGDRDRYRANGLDTRARRLVDALARAGIGDASVLDVGSGLGLVSFDLLARGAASATLSDASEAYLDAAREEATARGMADRTRVAVGDFVEIAPHLAPADVVVLDRVVCCYPAWRPLLEAAAGHCKRVLGITYPPARPDVRAVIAFENARRRWFGDGFRAFVHPTAGMEGALRASGLRRVSRTRTFVWTIDVYVRDLDPRQGAV